MGTFQSRIFYAFHTISIKINTLKILVTTIPVIYNLIFFLFADCLVATCGNCTMLQCNVVSCDDATCVLVEGQNTFYIYRQQLILVSCVYSILGSLGWG